MCAVSARWKVLEILIWKPGLLQCCRLCSFLSSFPQIFPRFSTSNDHHSVHFLIPLCGPGPVQLASGVVFTVLRFGQEWDKSPSIYPWKTGRSLPGTSIEAMHVGWPHFFYPDARIGMRTPSDSYWFFWVGRTKNQIWSGNDFQDIWWGETESGEQLTTADSGDTFLVPSMEHSHCFVADGELQDLLRPNAILPSSQMFRREAGWGRWREQFLIVFVFVPRYIDRYQAMKWYLARTWFWWIKINSFHFARSLRDSNRSCRARRASTFKHDSSPTDH